jgi:uncharacterized coiled-coil protein SlyX
MTDLSSRIDELETRQAHHEKIIGELNDVITQQWRKFAELERHMLRLTEELQSIDRAGNSIDRPPPHY